MKKSIFAVCDLEDSYVRNLTEYMNEKKSTPFEVQAFTSLESLSAFAAKNHIEILLISTEAMRDEIREMDIQRIVILSDGETINQLAEEPQVYKYQSSDSLLAEVMNYYAETVPEPVPVTASGCGAELIGVYSPLSRVGKTMFSLTLGEILAKSRRVLYLNLEDYNGFEALFDQTYRSDLSDLIYFARQKEGSLIYRLNGMIQTLYNLDYIPPAFSPCDLRDVSYEEWLKFLGEIGACTEYDVIILDMGSQIEEWFQILRQCARIYMPVLDDDISRAKILQFEKMMNALDCQSVLEKIRKIHLPPWKDKEDGQNRMEYLLYGEMGQYVRRLLEEESGKGQKYGK